MASLASSKRESSKHIYLNGIWKIKKILKAFATGKNEDRI